MVTMLQLGDLNTDARMATTRPRAEINWACEDIRNRVEKSKYRVLVPVSATPGQSRSWQLLP